MKSSRRQRGSGRRGPGWCGPVRRRGFLPNNLDVLLDTLEEWDEEVAGEDWAFAGGRSTPIVQVVNNGS